MAIKLKKFFIPPSDKIDFCLLHQQNFTYPSTSFSGATALVTFSVSIGLTESRGSCTMRPWTAGFSLTVIM